MSDFTASKIDSRTETVRRSRVEDEDSGQKSPLLLISQDHHRHQYNDCWHSVRVNCHTDPEHAQILISKRNVGSV